MNPQHPRISTWWRSLAGLASLGFGAVVAFFLVTEHRAHLFGVLPFLLLLTCPIMMLFMHRGHHHQGHTYDDSEPAHPTQEKRA